MAAHNGLVGLKALTVGGDRVVAQGIVGTWAVGGRVPGRYHARAAVRRFTRSGAPERDIRMLGWLVGRLVGCVCACLFVRLTIICFFAPLLLQPPPASAPTTPRPQTLIALQ